jgi:hypothetical protein
MNLLIKITPLFILVSLVFSTTFAQDCEATLSIKTDLYKCSIFINDSLVSTQKFFETKIDKGLHVVFIQENSYRWDSKSFIDTLLITDCGEYEINKSFHSDILLDTEPQDVYVFRNDSLIGFTPLRIAADFEMLHLQKPGYLAKQVTKDEVFTNSKITLDFIGEEWDESFIDGILFKVLVGTAVELGATTAHFKLQADEKFEQYQITGDPELLDQTEKLDFVSGVTFVALQINFGFIIYMFLTD